MPISRAARMALVPLFFAVASATAATFQVNATADGADANPGDRICAAADGSCTVRAALQEANLLPGRDRVQVPAGTYPLDDSIVDPLLIEDDVDIVGAGAQTTILDGQDATEILRARTLEVAVVDSTDNAVVSHNRFGVRNRTFVPPGLGGLSRAVAITVDPVSQDVFVAGFASGVHRYDADTGAFLSLFVPPVVGGVPIGPTDAQFAPLGVSGGDLFVTSFAPGGGVLRFDRTTGASKGVFVPAGSGGLAFPNSIAWHDGDMFVTSTGTHSVLRYDGASGSFKGAFVSGGLLRTPRRLVFHGDSLYVASEDTDSVIRYDAATGSLREEIVRPGSGGLDRPFDLSFGPDGHLYVQSAGTEQILRYDGASGQFKDVFVQGGTTGLRTISAFLFRSAHGSGALSFIGQLTLARGDSRGLGARTAGLFVDPGSSVTVEDVIVRGNESSVFGGGIHNSGTLVMRRVEVSGNKLPVGLGGQTSQGGGIYNAGVLTVEDSLIAGNFAGKGGGITNSGSGRVTVVNSTISGNKTNGGGGGIRNLGGIVDLSFVTITGNRAREPGGSEPNAFGGGIYNLLNGTVIIANSILAGNSDGRSRFDGADFSPDCFGTDPLRTLSARDNLIGILTDNCLLVDHVLGDRSGFEFGTADQPLAPGLVEMLGDNGGPTRTHALLPGSRAIDGDRSDNPGSGDDCRARDQRQLPRRIDFDRDGFARCDLGAYELALTDDADGVPDAVEDGAPNGGDGNSDGIPDKQQPNVASLPNAVDSRYVTVVASSGSVLTGVRTATAPTAGRPRNVSFPFGTVGFTVTANPRATVELLLPAGVTVTDYYKFGSEASNANDHWYRFAFDGTTGAIVQSDRIRLELVDGQRGDDDLTVNGLVVDPGAPSIPNAAPLVRCKSVVAAAGASCTASVTTAQVDDGSSDPEGGALTCRLSPAGPFVRGTTPVTLVCADPEGAEGSCQTTVTVQDTTPPWFSTPPKSITVTDCTGPSLGAVAASDNCGAVTLSRNMPSKFPLGITTVTWTAVDAAGNRATATQQVTAVLGDDASCCPSGTNVIVGTDGADVLVGTQGADCMVLRGGNDVVNSFGGADFISGGSGNDTITSGEGDDHIQGGPGTDTCFSPPGKDVAISCEVGG